MIIESTLCNKIGSISFALANIFLFLIGIWGDNILLIIVSIIFFIGAIYLAKIKKIGKLISLVGIILLIIFNIYFLIEFFIEIANENMPSYLLIMGLIYLIFPLIYFLITFFVILKAKPKGISNLFNLKD